MDLYLTEQRLVKHSKYLEEETEDSIRNETPGDKLNWIASMILGERETKPFSTDDQLALVLYEKIPLKAYQGNISLSRTAAGNPKARYHCEIMHRIYNPSGWTEESDKYISWADGATKAEAITKAFLLGILQNIFETPPYTRIER